MKTKLLVSACVLLFLAGCQNVPTNKLSMSLPNGKQIQVITEKNNAISGFKLVIDPATGRVEMSFDSWVGTNDPSIVQANAAGNTAQLQIATQAVLNGVKAGLMATNPTPPVPNGLMVPERSVQLHNPTNWSKHEFDPTTNSAAH